MAGGNSLWDIDSNVKLARWCFVIHGGIDRFSRVIVYLKCDPNNPAQVDHFLEVEGFHGKPSRVCSDYGSESIKVGERT